MDNSGPQMQNTTTNTSPFAPVDIPDLNDISAPSAMPPMGVASTTSQGENVASAATAQVASSQPQPQSQPQAASNASGATEVKAQSVPTTASAKDVKMSDIPEPAIVPEVKSKSTEDEKPAAGGTKAEAKAAVDTKAPVANKTVKDVEVASASLPSTNASTGSLQIETLLEECIKRNASDLHLQVGLPPILRMDGVLQPMTTYPVLTDMMVQTLVFSTLDADQKVILKKDKEFDYSFAFGDLGRFRVNAFSEKGNMAAAFRLIPNVIKTIEELGIPGVVADFAEHPNGLVLVTGPTGSGKSTTLAALIDKVNTERADHIITIEDPIEFTHTSKRSVVAQREVHYDTYSFAAALRSILREDPDVVLIGEMRDLETIQAAITVAETGHLVFATLHTNSAAQSIDRMIDVFPAHQQPQIRAQLANILVGICSQRLVPAINGGRVAVAEILVSNAATRSIIREGKTHQLDMVIQTGMSQGMQTMDRELAKYVRSGIISYDVAREYTVDATEFDRLARG